MHYIKVPRNDKKMICTPQFLFSSRYTLRIIFIFCLRSILKACKLVCKIFGKYVDRSLIYRRLGQTDATRAEVCISKPDLIELIESWNVFFFPSVFHVSDWKPSTFHSLNSFLDSFRGHSKSTFAQDSRVLTHSSPLVRPCSFWSNPRPPPLPSPQRYVRFG